MEREYTQFFEFGLKTVDEAGRFTGYASTFGNEDLQGDVVMPGAFTATLKQNQGKVPILMGHTMMKIVGFGMEAEEDGKGLKVTGAFTLASDDGRNAYATSKHAAEIGHKLGLSIGYMIRKNGAEYDEAAKVRRLKSVDLLEYSIAAVPANPRARMTGVKAATVREAERWLRTYGGMSHDEAREFLSMCKAERDVTPNNDNDDLERDVKDLDRSEQDLFMATLRQQSLAFEMRKGFTHAG